MTRLEIRNLVRQLIDQPYEKPDGSFYNTDLNILINIAKDKVVLALAPIVPGLFTTKVAVDVTAGDSSYSILTDWGITDCFMPWGLIRNLSNELRLPLLYGSAEDRQLISNLPNRDSVMWGVDEEGTVEVAPPSKDTASDRFMFYYIKKVADLNDDSTDDVKTSKVATPGFNSIGHPLIAYVAAGMAMITDERISADVDMKYQELLYDISWTLSQIPGARHDVLIPTRAIFNGGMVYGGGSILG